MPVGKTFRKYAGKARKAVVGAVKKRYAPKGKINYAKIANDAAKLVKLMNVEKKYQTNTVQSRTTSSTGADIYDCTPVIAQGLGGENRTGNSVKLVSARMDIQIKTQSAVTNAIKYKYWLICKPDGVYSSLSTVIGQFLDPNVFSSAIDYHSQRDPEFFKSYRVICTGQGTIAPEQLSAQQGIAQFHRNLKLSHHLKYDNNSFTSTTQNAMFLVMVADTGDSALNTGLVYDTSIRYWYVDN